MNKVTGLKSTIIPQTFGSKQVQQAQVPNSNIHITSPNMPYVVPANPNMPISYTQIGTQKTAFGDTVLLYQLANGQKVAICPRKGETHLQTFVNVGALNETDKIRGISHYIEHNLFNGGGRLQPGDAFKIAESMGANINACTDHNGTDYYIYSSNADEKDLKTMIEMQADMLTKPAFMPDMLQKEKGVVCEEVNMYQDMLSREIDDIVLKNLFQINSVSQDLTAGTVETVSNLTREDVVNYYNTYYTPDNMVTVVVGEVDPNKTMQMIAQNFNAPPKPESITKRITEKLNPIQQPKRVDMISKKDEKATLSMQFVGPLGKTSCREELAVDFAMDLMKLRARHKLEEELQIEEYYWGSGRSHITTNLNDPQVISIRLKSPEENIEKAIKLIYEALEDIKTNPPTEEEMTILRNKFELAEASAYESNGSILADIGYNLKNDTVQDIGKALEVMASLTPQDLISVSQKYLNLNKVSLGVVHAKNTDSNTIQNNYVQANSRKIQKSNISFSGRVKNISSEGVKQLKLPDNTTLILNDSDSPLCYFDKYIESKGWTKEDFALDILLRGLQRRGTSSKTKEQFEREKDLIGIEGPLNKCLPKNLTKALELENERLFSPRFTEEDFEKAKKDCVQFFKTIGNDAKLSVFVDSELYPTKYMSNDEKIAFIEKATLQDVQNYYQNLLSKGSSILVVSAPFSKTPGLEEAVIQASTTNLKFKDLDTSLEKMHDFSDTTPKVYLKEEEGLQANIESQYLFEITGNLEDNVKFKLLSTILGGGASSRLFTDLREKQKLAYSTGSFYSDFHNTGRMSLHIGTTTEGEEGKSDNVQKSLEGFKKHVELLKTQPVSEEELEAAKKSLKEDLMQSMQHSSSKIYKLLELGRKPAGIQALDKYSKIIDSVTPKDIQIAAQYAFKNPPVVSMTASANTLNSQMEYLRTQGTVKVV